jgi:hypothetical protein
VLLPLQHGTKSNFLGESYSWQIGQTAKLAKSSEATVQRNSLRGLQFKRSTQTRRLPPDLDEVNYAKLLKVTKAERLKKMILTHVLSGIRALLTSGKRQTHVFGQSLWFKQRQYDHFY